MRALPITRQEGEEMLDRGFAEMAVARRALDRIPLDDPSERNIWKAWRSDAFLRCVLVLRDRVERLIDKDSARPQTAEAVPPSSEGR